MIRSFRDKETGKVFRREFSRKLQGIAVVAKRKLDHLQAAADISDLAMVPGNRLETLAGDRVGQYSIRVTTSGAHASAGFNPMLMKLR